MPLSEKFASFDTVTSTMAMPAFPVESPFARALLVSDLCSRITMPDSTDIYRQAP